MIDLQQIYKSKCVLFRSLYSKYPEKAKLFKKLLNFGAKPITKPNPKTY